jgi:hypothetical protein
MPENPPFIIPTRQKADVLFHTSDPLAAGGSFIPARPALVLGYDTVAILAISDQPFGLSIEEACDADGPFVQTNTLTSSAAGGFQRICARIRPCGAYMTIALGNLGAAMEELDFCAQGIPLP